MKEKLSIFCSCKSGYSKGLWGFDSIFVLDLTPKSKFWHHQDRVLSVKLFWAPGLHWSQGQIHCFCYWLLYIWYILRIFIYLFKVNQYVLCHCVIKFSNFSLHTWFYQNCIQDTTSSPLQPPFGLHIFFFLYGTLRPSYLILDRKSRVFIRQSLNM